MRILIAGQKEFGAAVYRMAIGEGLDVAAVAAPAMRGDGQPDRLRGEAERAGTTWIASGRLRADTMPVGVDVIVAAHSHDFIGAKTRARTRLGAIGYHPSLLPLHRGRDAVRWAVHMRERVTGGTVYWLSESIDAGDVAAQRHVFIDPGEDAGELWREKLMPLGVELLRATLRDLKSGLVRRRPQDHRLATWEPSWERAPAFRPELDLIGSMPAGFQMSRMAG
jgi:methionyl-tRNA formyltransferase